MDVGGLKSTGNLNLTSFPNSQNGFAFEKVATNWHHPVLVGAFKPPNIFSINWKVVFPQKGLLLKKQMKAPPKEYELSKDLSPRSPFSQNLATFIFKGVDQTDHVGVAH